MNSHVLPLSFLSQGNALQSGHRFEDAAAAYREALVVRPKDGGFTENLASALSNRGVQLLQGGGEGGGGDLPGAAAAFRAALDVDSTHQDARRHLTAIMRRLQLELSAKDGGAKLQEMVGMSSRGSLGGGGGGG